MNYEEYMKKIQSISVIVENAKYIEDILNSKELDIKEDFQYICLNSTYNYDLVNEAIARIAQNGNGDIIKENIKIISLSTWKDLYKKNDAIRQIFLENFGTIQANTSIVTYREIESFFNDSDVLKLIYDNLDDIIKKLCTYDRASIVYFLGTKENGADTIKSHLPSFFQKGNFDISTAYSKVLYALEKVQGITRFDILEALNPSLGQMLSRETAIDNETNKVLSWVYDAFEETKMSDDEWASIKSNIDAAILENFQEILERSCYDKETIKLLKQFDCTRSEFEKNQNHFIDKSNEESVLPYNVETEVKSDEEKNIEEVCCEEEAEEINDDGTKILEELPEEVYEEKTVTVGANNEKVLAGLWSNVGQSDKNVVAKFESEELTKKAIPEDVANGEEAAKTYVTSKDLIDSYIQKYVGKVDNESEANLDERLEKILVSNVEETNKIINKVLNKNAEAIKNAKEGKIESIQNISDSNVEKCNDIKENNNEKALVTTEQGIDFVEEKNIFLRIWEKILKIFRRDGGFDRIGE